MPAAAPAADSSAEAPRQVEVAGGERRVGAAVGQHRALVVLEQDHHRAGGQHRVGREPAHDTVRLESPPGRRAGVVVAHPRHQGDRHSRRRQPRRGVAAGAARDDPHVAGRVPAAHHAGLGPNQHVEPDVADDDDRPNGHARLPEWSAASSTATSAARAALASTSSTLARRLSPPELSWKNSSRRGVTSLPETPSRGQLGQSGRDEPVVEDRVDLSRLGQGVRQDDARRVRAEERAGVRDGRCLRRGLHPPRDGRAGVGEVEPRELVGAVPQHRDGQRLQPLQGGGDVEDRLHAGADHEHRRVASTPRSAEMSNVSAAPRCTPPSPPVAKTPDARAVASARSRPPWWRRSGRARRRPRGRGCSA